MIVDRQTQIHTQTDTLITILRFPIGGGVTKHGVERWCHVCVGGVSVKCGVQLSGGVLMMVVLVWLMVAGRHH